MQENAGKCRKSSMETGGYNRINVKCAERQMVMHDRLIESNHGIMSCSYVRILFYLPPMDAAHFTIRQGYHELVTYNLRNCTNSPEF